MQTGVYRRPRACRQRYPDAGSGLLVLRPFAASCLFFAYCEANVIAYQTRKTASRGDCEKSVLLTPNIHFYGLPCMKAGSMKGELWQKTNSE